MTLIEICRFLNEELKIEQIHDEAMNGLQVEGRLEVNNILLAVDGACEVFTAAAEARADMVIVHHGLFWGKPAALTGPLYQRVKILIENGISLYAAHLPLDIHPELGNNARLMNLFKTTEIRSFGKYGGVEIGLIGNLKQVRQLEDIKENLEASLKTKCHLLAFGSSEIKTIGIISGGGAGLTVEAIREGVDLFITGEPKLPAYHLAKEGKMNLIFAGHYATETRGLKAVARLLEDRFSVSCNFFDLPTGI